MEQLINKRRTIKANITRIYNYCNSSEAAPDQILARAQNLEKYFELFEEIQSAIEAEVGEQELQQQEQYRMQLETKYYSARAVIAQQQQQHNMNAGTIISDNNEQGNQQLTVAMDTLARNQSAMGLILERLTSPPLAQEHPDAVQPYSSVKLPSIKLPEFDGTYGNWIHFRDMFEALINNRTNLSNIEKMEYLKAHVSGDALSVIKHLNASNENYTVAWNLIKRKYDNNSEIKNNYLKLLFDQPSMKGPYASDLKRLLNSTNESVNALNAMNENTEQWNSVLLFNLVRKMDIESQTLWHRRSTANTTATMSTFIEFMEGRLRELELFNNKPTSTPAANKPLNKWSANIHTTITSKLCPICKADHFIFRCRKFIDMSIDDRINTVKNNNLCFNCLQVGHRSTNCNKSTCKTCHSKHNTMLHRDNNQVQQVVTTKQVYQPAKNEAVREIPETVNINTIQATGNKITLLPTAIVLIKNANNNYQPCRVLIDTGAQATLVAESCVQFLQLKKSFDNTILSGVGSNSTSQTRGKAQLIIKPYNSTNELNITALCLKHLTQFQPACNVSSKELQYYNNLHLADQQYNVPNRIDVILGADVFNQIYLDQRIVHPTGSSSALLTIFGWVIIGNIATNTKTHVTIAHSSINITSQLQQFWQIEEVPENKDLMTEEEQLAENYYQNTVTRCKDGKYVVRLPFKDTTPEFGNTIMQATKRLNNMESRFKKDATLQQDYKKFMNEYINLQHMEPMSHPENAKYYLPHHAVLKTDSTTTKLRVVFDGSCKGTNGISLNEKLLTGPTIQKDLFTIILQFRKYKIALSGDIEKMYRQIWIHPDDRKYQCIVWRNERNLQLATYQLNTITYGTSAAPFLAVRTLKQIAIDTEKENPTISETILSSFYVDDFMLSTNTTKEAIELRAKLSATLLQAGMHLRKWSCNSQDVIKTIDEKDREMSADTIIDDSQTVKTLGLYWNTNADTFKYSLSIPKMQPTITKRQVLSIISRIFDPIGWLAPVIIKMKVFMQKLWLRGLDWDTALPEELVTQWTQLYDNMQYITQIQVPRWLQFSNEATVEIHGFADSSELAYAAAIYLKVIHTNGEITTRLIASKTRVAPVKQISLPRLELCACQLLVKLLVKVTESLNLKNVETYGWTDSTIVLAWLADHPRKWKNFIANRTSYIINVLPVKFWRHIPSSKNPADFATRGLSPSELETTKLWWHGPDELKEFNGNQQFEHINHTTDEEIRKATICHANVNQQELFHLYSDFYKLLRITATIIRFIKNCKLKSQLRQTGFLTTMELQHAHNLLIKRSQQLTFKDELNVLSSNNQLSAKHKLASLTPFLDADGVLRVGGRLLNANISHDQMHPIILDKNCLLTQSIIRWYHIKHLHAGTRQLQYLLGLKYWIPSVTYAAKRCVYKCPRCMRFRNKPYQQQMGPLPKYRIEGCTAFENVGIDFAGPILVRSWKGRGSKQYKCWISLFVCLATKAIHLEAVTDLSSEAFIAALRRFVARRGKPANIYTDNGTNFVGANQKLKDVVQFLRNNKTCESITKQSAEIGIQWHFIPPAGPNFGGIWEAGVKSAKYHLNRILNNSAVTYEELTTMLCQIEQCLNSRPLSAKFEGDVDPLTPAHFLILRSTQTVPDRNYMDDKITRLNRWQYLQQLIQSFWKKWSSEYLVQLQIRPKWKNKMENLKKDDIVFVKDEQSPPCKWPIGKVLETHPGQDGLVRVVTVKTQNGVYKRPISKLCPLVVDI